MSQASEFKAFHKRYLTRRALVLAINSLANLPLIEGPYASIKREDDVYGMIEMLGRYPREHVLSTIGSCELPPAPLLIWAYPECVDPTFRDHWRERAHASALPPPPPPPSPPPPRGTQLRVVQ